MFDFNAIYQAQSPEDAIRALKADPSALVIAGGTDILIKIREGRLAGCSLVSIHGLREQGVDRHTGGIEQGVANGGRHRDGRRLPQRFVAKGP